MYLGDTYDLLLQEESEDKDQKLDIEDKNHDTDASVWIEECEENSESIQIDSSASEEEGEVNAAYLSAVQQKRNVVENEWKW